MLESSQEYADLVISFRAMRRGLLTVILGSLLTSGALSTSAGTAAAFANPAIAVAFLGAGLGGFATAALALVGVILGLVGFYFMFIPGITDLKGVEPEYSKPALLIENGYMFGLILLIFGMLLSWSVFGFLILVASLVLLIIGLIGMIMLCFKLHSNEGSDLYMAAGILLIIGIFINIATLISYALMYLALGKTIKRYSTPKQQT